MKRRSAFCLLPSLLVSLCLCATSVSGAVWTTSDYAGFSAVRAELENVSISWDGVVSLGPDLTRLASLDEASVWAVAEVSGRTLAATGNRGRLYSLRPGTDPHIAADLETGQILAVCADRRGNVYFGATPDGIIYRLASPQPVEIVATGESYVFALLPGPSGELYCATGTNGKLIRISPSGAAETIFTAPHAHITALAWLVEGKELLVGTAPGGLVFRLRFSPGQDRPEASVLYDTGLEEVRSIAVLGPSLVAVAANPGATARDSTPRVACVTIAGALRWTWTCPESTLFTLLPHASSPTLSLPLQGGGNRREVVRSGLLAATGNDGTIFFLDTLGRATLLARTGDLQAVSLTPAGRDVRIGTASGAAVYTIGSGFASSGRLLSEPHDCAGPARFGRISVRATVPAGTALAFDTRSGNSSQPDSTWSDWQEAGELVRSPAARFIQWRARLSTRFPNLTPRVEQVDVYYRVPNRAPTLNRLELAAVTAPESGKPLPVRAVTWEADDPDSDSLIFELQFRSGEQPGPGRWQTLAKDLSGTSYDLDTRTLPDGWCRLKLIASDRLSQPADAALVSEFISRPILIDNTPPRITALSVAGATLAFDAADETSPISACRYSVNAGPWRPLLPSDGVYDSKGERFHTVLTLEPGENTVAVWAADAHGNTTVSAVSARR